MRRLFRRFKEQEDGATTVDWVVITAMAMSLALAAFGGVSTGTKGITEEVSTTVGGRTILTTFN